MPGAADDKKKRGSSHDPDEDLKLNMAGADLTMAARKAARGITTMTENIKPSSITNIYQADRPEKSDTKATGSQKGNGKDSASSSETKK